MAMNNKKNVCCELLTLPINYKRFDTKVSCRDWGFRVGGLIDIQGGGGRKIRQLLITPPFRTLKLKCMSFKLKSQNILDPDLAKP